MKTLTIRDRTSLQKIIRRMMPGCLLIMPVAVQGGSQPPTIQLFPTTVLEEIKHTGDVAAQMETGLQTVIGRLDEQQKLYMQSKCEGNEGDPGCERIARQMGKSYLEMLAIMGDRLPEMETAVNNTSASLEKRLRSELGQKRTSWTLQELLVGAQSDSANKTDRPVLRGRSGMRLSDRFHQYYKLVAHSGGEANSSLAVIASDIYLDMQETSHPGGNQPGHPDGTAQPVVWNHHTGNAGSSRRGEIHPVWGGRDPDADDGATRQPARAGR